MNYTHLVESGQYKKDELSIENRMFVNGMEDVIERIECFVEDYSDNLDDYGDLILAIKKEYIKGIMTDFKEYIKRCTNQVIVELIDSQEEK